MTEARLVDAPALPPYDLGPGHPFRRDRQLPLFDLLRRHRLYGDEELLRAPAADDDVLCLAHERRYIEFVRSVSEDHPSREALLGAPEFGLGTADNPIEPGQHEGARAIAGATRACVQEVMSGRARRAFNPAGGLHHAMPAAASGFCVYNDLVVGIREALALGAERVLYVDFDVHHGDGVERAFYSDPRVTTLSFHEDPNVRWPCTGHVEDLGAGEARGTAVNVPLASGTDDASWLQAVHAILPPLARRFQPSLIVSQHGCDPHRDDPLAALELTVAPMVAAARLSRELSEQLCEGRWVATGGGGYQPVRVLPRVWAQVWCVVADRALPEAIDPAWIAAWQHAAAQPLPRTWDDPPRPSPHAERAARTNLATIAQLRALLELG